MGEMTKEQLKMWMKILIVVIVLILAGLFIVKTIDSNKPAEQQTTTEQKTTIEPQFTESNEDTIEESATPLTEDELKDLCIKAHNLYAEWFSPENNLVVDWDNTLKIDNREYFEVASTEITSVEALKTEFAKYFDSEEIDDKIDSYYVMHNGKMYGASELIQGGEIDGMKHKMTIKKNTNTECLLEITSYLDGFEQDFYYRLRVIDGEWKFAGVFHWVTQYDLVLE